MRSYSQLHGLSLCCVVGILFLSGCSHLNHTENGALVGSGIGAAAGTVIGHQSGNEGAGALIGAATGAIGGAIVGHAEQMEEERDAALAAAQHAQWQRQAAAQAVTNQDVIRMTHGGLSESLIVNAIHTRGGRFNTAPDALIGLKSEGVGDSVIQAMQQGTVTGAANYAGATTVIPSDPSTVVAVPQPSTTVYITPPPPVGVVVGPSRVVFGPHRHWRADIGIGIS